MDYFTIDHDRENDPDIGRVEMETQEELAHMEETALQKVVFNELDALTLKRIFRRANDLSYFLGRLHGEKYKGELK